jgi:short-subunit dehydrogenase
MQIHNARIVLTGASGGIGQALAAELATRGARLGLVGRDLDKLRSLAQQLTASGAELECIGADLTQAEGCAVVLRQMQARFGGVDILINNAGITDFTEFSAADPARIEQLFRTNVLAPMQLSRALLPDMLAQGRGQIVNVGSIFGSIAFACFASYSASKFALRGFSEALRRELDGSGVGVTYVAPRAVRTALNTAAVYRMAERVKMAMDTPEQVAGQIVRAIEQDRKDVYLGFPEALFVRINALWPRLVDVALSKQNRIMREFTREG